MSKAKQIRLTFKEGGCRQIRSGKYSSAVVEQKVVKKENSNKKKVLYLTKKTMQTIEKPVCEESFRVLILGEEFLENCERKPAGSYRRSSAKHWRKLPFVKKIEEHAKDLAFDFRSTLFSMEVLS